MLEWLDAFDGRRRSARRRVLCLSRCRPRKTRRWRALCGATVEGAFDAAITGTAFLMESGDLLLAGGAVLIPSAVLDVWPRHRRRRFWMLRPVPHSRGRSHQPISRSSFAGTSSRPSQRPDCWKSCGRRMSPSLNRGGTCSAYRHTGAGADALPGTTPRSSTFGSLRYRAKTFYTVPAEVGRFWRKEASGIGG